MRKEPSGVNWVRRFPQSTSVDDLAEPFRANVKRFLAALTAAGARVIIASTLRPRERAYLMHYSAAISRRSITPERVPPMDGVSIEWVHSSVHASLSAAMAMASAYRIVYPPAIESSHTRGRAIDMRIEAVLGKSVATADGSVVSICKHADRDSDLFAIGATYDVIKLVPDIPHWSENGR